MILTCLAWTFESRNDFFDLVKFGRYPLGVSSQTEISLFVRLMIFFSLQTVSEFDVWKKVARLNLEILDL
jgi:hypothetical protein